MILTPGQNKLRCKKGACTVLWEVEFGLCRVVMHGEQLSFPPQHPTFLVLTYHLPLALPFST